MSNYDQNLSDAKMAVTKSMMKMISNPVGSDIVEFSGLIDRLNQAWDELTDALRRQRDEYRNQVDHLIRELAEAKKK